ncbi:MAG TPA: class I SAM-dependent methyltransferase [Gammaproteobacteria bacterium]
MNREDRALFLPAADRENVADLENTAYLEKADDRENAAGRRESDGAAMASVLEHVPCELCGGTVLNTRFTAKETRSWWIAKCKDDPRLDPDFEFPIVECAECRHVFVSPRLNAEVNGELYARYWRETGPKPARASEYADYVCRQLAALGRKGTLLDFGCGWGTQLEAAVRNGWQAVGLEVDPRKIDYCREHGLHAVLGDLRDRPFPEASFDAAVAEQVFEHLYSPIEYMRELHRVLKPGGLLYVAVPNLGGIDARSKGPRWDMVHPASHVRYFDRASLADLLSRCGFDVLRPAYVRRFGRAPIRNAAHAVKTFLERNLRYYPLGLALVGRKPHERRLPT